MYNKGEGAESSIKRSDYWFNEEAKNGNPKAMLQLGKWLLGEAERSPRNKKEALHWLEKAADESEHDNLEVIWEARWILAEIYEYGLYGFKKDINSAKYWYEQLVDNGDESARIYAKLMSRKKEDPSSKSPGWVMKHLISKFLTEHFPDLDATGSLYEKEDDTADAEFTAAEREECLPVAEKILALADMARRKDLSVFAEKSEQEEDIYMKTALSLAAVAIHADLFKMLLKILFIKDKPKGSQLLKRQIICHGIYLIISGDFTAEKLKILLGSLYVPRLLTASADSEENKYKMTFNYLFTHCELPKLYFKTLDSFYNKIFPDPHLMEKYLFIAYNRCVYLANENSEIERPFDIEKCDMYIHGDTAERCLVIITLPKCNKVPDSYQIAIPSLREKAGYFTCELSIDPETGEHFFILGELDAERRRQNYGKIKMKSETSFADMALDIIYGK